jgi:hypothetical protein
MKDSGKRLVAAALVCAVATCWMTLPAAAQGTTKTTPISPGLRARRLTLSAVEAQVVMSRVLAGAVKQSQVKVQRSSQQLLQAYGVQLAERQAALTRFNQLVGLPFQNASFGIEGEAAVFGPNGTMRQSLIARTPNSQAYVEFRCDWTIASTGVRMNVGPSYDPGQNMVTIEVFGAGNVITGTRINHVNSVTANTVSTAQVATCAFTLFLPSTELDTYFKKLDETYTYLQTHPN